MSIKLMVEMLSIKLAPVKGIFLDAAQVKRWDFYPFRFLAWSKPFARLCLQISGKVDHFFPFVGREIFEYVQYFLFFDSSARHAYISL